MGATTPRLPPADLASFTDHLQKSKRIMALLGAGLSASSGLPTFRGPGGYWRSFDATHLATPNAFNNNPGLVWQFYSYRRHMALNAKPNGAHLALAELARRIPRFITLSQNVDGLSPRAGHPSAQLKLLHGSLYDIKCSSEICDYMRPDDFTDPIVPALAIPADPNETHESLAAQTGASAKKHALIRGLDISSDSIPIPEIPLAELPQCPQCKTHPLRPGVVWFGETLPDDVIESVEAWIGEPEPIDLMLVIGTSSKVYPAAGYTEKARRKGARVAVVNVDPSDARNLRDGDWFFHGDAAAIVPELLKCVVGEIAPLGDGSDAKKE